MMICLLVLLMEVSDLVMWTQLSVVCYDQIMTQADYDSSRPRETKYKYVQYLIAKDVKNEVSKVYYRYLLIHN